MIALRTSQASSILLYNVTRSYSAAIVLNITNRSQEITEPFGTVTESQPWNAHSQKTTSWQSPQSEL